MNEIRFTRNTENTLSFGKFLARNLTRSPGFQLEDVVVLRSPPLFFGMNERYFGNRNSVYSVIPKLE